MLDQLATVSVSLLMLSLNPTVSHCNILQYIAHVILLTCENVTIPLLHDLQSRYWRYIEILPNLSLIPALQLVKIVLLILHSTLAVYLLHTGNV